MKVAKVTPWRATVPGLMPTPLHLKPPFAAWLVRGRRRLNWKTHDVVNALAAQGIVVAEGTVKVWESNGNRTPEPTTIEALERIFSSAAPTAAAPAGDQAELYRLLVRQTEAMESLTERLDWLLFSRRIGSSEVDAALEEADRLVKDPVAQDAGRSVDMVKQAQTLAMARAFLAARRPPGGEAPSKPQSAERPSDRSTSR